MPEARATLMSNRVNPGQESQRRLADEWVWVPSGELSFGVMRQGAKLGLERPIAEHRDCSSSIRYKRA